MSEKRSQEAIQADYGNACARVGERNFRMEVMKVENQKDYEYILALGKEMQEATKSKEESNGPVTSATATAA